MCCARAHTFCRMWNTECGKLSRGNLRKIKCRIFRKLPLISFPHSAAEKFCISAYRKTTVRMYIQKMCNRCTAASGVPRFLPSVFFVVSLPKNREFLQFRLTSSMWLASICIMGATVAKTIARIKRLIPVILGETRERTIRVKRAMSDVLIFRRKNSDVRFRCLVIQSCFSRQATVNDS